jgi:predicted enzyme related to lactoylglutathione lyase
MTTNTDTGAPIGWFEIGTDDPDTARTFYGQAFGWTFAVDGPYSIITTGRGHALPGGIQDTSVPLPEGTPRSYAVPCVQVTDVAATCAKIEEFGGKVMVPATSVPTGLVYAHVSDPAGNHIGLFMPPA